MKTILVSIVAAQMIAAGLFWVQSEQQSSEVVKEFTESAAVGIEGSQQLKTRIAERRRGIEELTAEISAY